MPNPQDTPEYFVQPDIVCLNANRTSVPVSEQRHFDGELEELPHDWQQSQQA